MTTHFSIHNLVLAVAIAVLPLNLFGAPAEPKDDRTKTVEIPEVRGKGGGVAFRAATVKCWVEQGWLIVRREQLNGDLDWQIVLAQATETEPPEVNLREFGSIEINYGRYFIRENMGKMRVFRERKTDTSPPWPAVPLPPGAKEVEHSGNRTVQRGSGVLDDWLWYASGPSENVYDIWVRVNHRLLSKSSEVRPGPMWLTQFGDCRIEDEGDLFIGQRIVMNNEEVKALMLHDHALNNAKGGEKSDGNKNRDQ
jgi:hypothetical protein